MKNVRIYHISDASRPIQPSSASARTAHDQMKRQRVIDIQSTGAEIDRIGKEAGEEAGGRKQEEGDRYRYVAVDYTNTPRFLSVPLFHEQHCGERFRWNHPP